MTQQGPPPRPGGPQPGIHGQSTPGSSGGADAPPPSPVQVHILLPHQMYPGCPSCQSHMVIDYYDTCAMVYGLCCLSPLALLFCYCCMRKQRCLNCGCIYPPGSRSKGIHVRPGAGAQYLDDGGRKSTDSDY